MVMWRECWSWNHEHVVAMVVKFRSGKGHQWMLNLGGHFDEGQDICMVLKCLPTDYLLDVREKIIIFLGRNWTAPWLGDQNLYRQGGAHRLHMPSAMTPGEENSVVFCLIMHRLN